MDEVNQKLVDEAETTLYKALRHHKEKGTAITDGFIDEKLKALKESKMLTGEINDAENRLIKFRIETRFNISLIDETIVLTNRHVQRWLDAKKEDLDWTYWQPFGDYLINQGRPEKILEENEKVIDAILDLSGNPKLEGNWERRGLVMGNVQSGKTQNYLGLVNKAIDTGYRIIIILGGHQNDLRDQTQKRVDEGIIGFESRDIFALNHSRIGVGKIRDIQAHPVNTFTTSNSDFNKRLADGQGINLHGLAAPAIFTIKKNVSILRNLYTWIKKTHELDEENGIQLDTPMLFIDDEADYASPNTRERYDEITATNEWIRKILQLFQKNTYVGYTATPFANIFIDPDSDEQMLGNNLFPRDFMIKISAPENYCGQDFFFGSESEEGKLGPIITIEDNTHMLPFSGHRKDMIIDRLCPSLEEAIRAFLISTSVRISRGGKSQHHSMMVNVTHLTALQNQIRELIDDYLKNICNAIEANAGNNAEEARTNKIVNQINETYNDRFDIDEKWKEIYPHLVKVARRIKIYSLNVKSDQRLDYDLYRENGLVAIIIGGHKLSRGITLEGLSVSYFARNSKMYDTLMQMCRWFGYRPDYQDLCKVYLPEQSLEWYQHISRAIDELYRELELMRFQEKTPSEFGLKVRDHPEALTVTARNKMSSAKGVVRSASLWGQRLRRFRWKIDKSSNKENLACTESFISGLASESDGTLNGGASQVFHDVPHKKIISFIRNMGLEDGQIGNDVLIKFINEMKESNLPNFRVCLRNQKKSSLTTWSKKLKENGEYFPETYTINGKDINLAKRTVKRRNDVLFRPSAEMGDKSDESVFLSKDEADRIRRAKDAINFDYRRSNERDFPTLIIYLFSLCAKTPFRKENKSEQPVFEIPSDYPFVGYAISFPKLSPENMKNMTEEEIKSLEDRSKEIVSYKMNVVYQQMELQFGTVDDEDEEYDED